MKRIKFVFSTGETLKAAGIAGLNAKQIRAIDRSVEVLDHMRDIGQKVYPESLRSPTSVPVGT